MFQKTDKQFMVLYALDGYDEISLTGATKVFSNNGESVLTPQDFGISANTSSSITGGETVDSSVAIFMNILQNNGSQEQQNVVYANAGMAIATAEKLSPIQGFEKAKESLTSGKALSAFKTLQKLSQS